MDSQHPQSVDYSPLYEILTEQSAMQIMHWCCNYVQGKQAKTSKSYLNRLNSSMTYAFKESKLLKLPKAQRQWQNFIKVLYGCNLTNPNSTSSLETRVKNWNAIFAPFLRWLIDQGNIPIGCIIPKMKRVGELNKHSSFKLQLTGTASPKPVKGSIEKLIIPVSLSRSDADYLDEFYFDLKTKRDTLDRELVKYWRMIKSHIETGKRMLDSVCFNEVITSMEDSCYELKKKKGEEKIRHIHKASIRYNTPNFLSILSNTDHGTGTLTNRNESLKYLPKERITNKNIDALGLSTDEFKLGPSHRLDLLLGNLSTIDVTIITMILLMRTPKFNFYSLLYANITDKDGYTYLNEKDSGWKFSVFKQRAKDKKTDYIDDLSFEILSTVIELGKKRRKIINTNKLFIVVKSGGGFSLPSEGVVLRKASSKSDSDQTNVLNTVASLKSKGFEPGMTTYRKLRDTEAVLEWFKSGSIRAVTKKIGNSEKVVLEHYLPASLIAIWNTRQIRRFQNLLLTAASTGESYSLEITDFNSLSELNNFISDMLNMHNGSKNPLIIALENNDQPEQKIGKLAVPISTKVLTSIYLYEEVASQTNVNSEVLKRKSVGLDLSPLSIIKLSLLLKQNLPDHRVEEFKQAHSNALAEVDKLKDKTSWNKLFISSEKVNK